MPGPAPKNPADRVRRNKPLANTVLLPHGGRVGEPPAWPLATNTPKIWASLWATPQAAQWELQGIGTVRVVARYALFAEEFGDETVEPNAALLGEIRQLEDRLGLTPMAMLRLRWEIDAKPVTAAVATPQESAAAATAGGDKPRERRKPKAL